MQRHRAAGENEYVVSAEVVSRACAELKPRCMYDTFQLFMSTTTRMCTWDGAATAIGKTRNDCLVVRPTLPTDLADIATRVIDCFGELDAELAARRVAGDDEAAACKDVVGRATVKLREWCKVLRPDVE